MEQRDYLKDISEIKNLMNRSSQFISLSGLAGVLAGVYALAGAFAANRILENYPDDFNTFQSHGMQLLLLIAAIVLVLSVATAVLLTYIKAQKSGEKIWNSASKRLLSNFMIPLASGGIFSLLLLKDGHYGLIVPAMLLFYGLACVSASKYTFRDVRYLGITMVLLGLAATAFPAYGLIFWALGFGLCHIVYGAIMHFKYDQD